MARSIVGVTLVMALAAGCGPATSAAPPGAGSTPAGGPSAASSSTTYAGVTYTPATVVIDAESVHNGLKGQDGTTFRFAAGTHGVDTLAAGKVMVLAGTAVRKVTGVQANGGDVVVQTAPAVLSDAIRTGTIGWKHSVDWAHLPLSSYKKAAFTSGLAGSTVQAGLRLDPGTYTVSGEVSGFDVDLDLTPKNDGSLHFELSASRSNIKVSANGSLSSFESDASLTYNPNTGELFNSTVHGLKGEAELEWHAIGVGSAFDSDVQSFTLPFSIPIPIEAGPLPMVLTVKSAIRFSPALTSKSSSGGSFKVSYDSDFGFSFDSPKPDPSATVRTVKAALGDPETVTAGFGPVGFGWGWEFPRLELSLAGTGTFAFLTFDTYMAGEFTPGTTLTADVPPCQRAEITMHAIAGYKVSVLGMTAASDKSTLWEKKFPFYKDDHPCTLNGQPADGQ